ncbi:MAG: hypothetical protein HY712_00715 [candidate division NC10 bacterium]|nr:hypothetical protein [candidate division NC10 bacterium]
MRYRVVGLLALLLALGPSMAGAQEAAYGSAAAEIAEKVAQAFPKVEGRVIGLEKERVLLDLGQKERVIPGLELQVFREGQEFKHPYTGQVLGKLDRDVGRVRIVEVRPNFSLAEVIQQSEGTMVQQGDHVRVTSARVILALPNVDVSDVAGANTRAVTRDLTNALVKTNRFEVMTDQRIRGALQEEKVAAPDQFTDPVALQALWKRLRVSAVLLGKLSLMEKGVQWDVQVISTVRGDSVTLASAEVRGAAPRPAPERSGAMGPDRPADRFGQVVMRSQDLPYRGQAMAAGDLTGDGSVTLAISDGQDVYLYAIGKAGLKELAKISGYPTDSIIALDAADINKNGVAEIFVTNTTDQGLRSYVLEYLQGKFTKILTDLPLNFRVLTGTDGVPRLYGQEGARDEPFRGDVREYTWQGKAYVPGQAAVRLPKEHKLLYGFAVADLDGDGVEEILVLDQQDRLSIYDRGGTEVYRTTDRYGGSETVVEYYPRGTAPHTRSGLEPIRIMVQGRIMVHDIFGDGKRSIVLPQNTASTGYMFRTRLYNKGKVFGIAWDGVGVLPMWESREFPGYLADFALVDFDGSGQWRLVGLSVRNTLFGVARIQSMVVVFDLKAPGK